jgi:hypothetical protein
MRLFLMMVSVRLLAEPVSSPSPEERGLAATQGALCSIFRL